MFFARENQLDALYPFFEVSDEFFEIVYIIFTFGSAVLRSGSNS